MATTKSRKTQKTNSGLIARTGRSVRDRPYVSAVIATGAVTAVAAVAAGTFFFTRKGRSFEEFTTRVKDGFAESSTKIRDRFAKDKPQNEIAEEALTLKETGARNTRPADPLVKDQLKAGTFAS